MNMKNVCLSLVLLLSVQTKLVAQSSGNAQASSREATVPVNNFTGIPSISIPLFNYGHQSGIGIGFALDYFAGGIKVNESPSLAGLGWNVMAGGMITRNVRSLPDDCPNKGFLYTPPVSTEIVGNPRLYQKECIDGEQDIFQFNFGGRSGKFYIGKDSQCVISPQSKMQIQCERTYQPINDDYIPDTIYSPVTKFTITTEEGVKYVFDNPEYTTTTVLSLVSGNNFSSNYLVYASAWNLSYIIAASGKDSIKFNYQKFYKADYNLANQTVQIENGTTTHSDTSSFYGLFSPFPETPNGLPGYQIISNIELPENKKVKFIYSHLGEYGVRKEKVLQRINVMDSVFRYGYLFNWDTTNIGANSKDFLRGINYYTKDSKKPGYEFTYNNPIFNYINYAQYPFYYINPQTSGAPFDLNYPLNKKDHWGFYNGANNTNDYVPTVDGIYNGANREPNALAVASSLASVKDPSGGITYYKFENNDTYPYNTSKQTVNIDASTNTSNSIAINRVLGNTTYIKIKFEDYFIKPLFNPLSGAGTMTVSITDLSANTVLFSTIVNLNEFFYTGVFSFSTTIPSGSYLLKTTLTGGTTSSIVFPINVSWFNQSSATGTANLVGGIRIKQISHYDPFSNKMDTISTYRYVRENGLSSGFLGIKPVYNYVAYNKQIIQSNALGNLDYGHGNSVGYERVEVIDGSMYANLGKKVYEYTNLSDVSIDISPAEYPFMQRIQREWGLGLPKKISIYDNTNRLIQKTTNNYNFNSIGLNNPNYTSVKVHLGLSYLAQKYYPEIGRTEMVNTTDTFYHTDLSYSSSWKNFVYDTNYNVIKIISPYDKNKNLNIEQRMYYPYHYTLAGNIGTLKNNNIFVPVSTETWLTGNATTPKLISLSATDYQRAGTGNKRSFIYKPYITYALETNKPIAESVIGTFNPAVLVRNTTLIKPQQSFLFDIQGKLLETTEVNTDLKNAIIYGNSNAVIAKVSNANYTDVAYTSFEKNSNGIWDITGTLFDTIQTFTGLRSYNLGSGAVNKIGLNTTKTYLLTYWTKGTVTFSIATTPTLTDQRNGWNLYTVKFTGTTSISLYGAATTLIDELRLHPIDANMESSTFNDFGNVLSTNDANNNIAYFEYDKIHRSKILRDKDKNIIKKFEYSDIITPIEISPKWVHLNINGDWSCTDFDTLTIDPSGAVYKMLTDTNKLSDTYNQIKYIYDHIDFTRCPTITPCDANNQLLKIINNVCETAQKFCVSSTRFRQLQSDGTYIYKWKCTFAYKWSDGTFSNYNCLYTSTNTSDPTYCTNNIYYFVEEHLSTCILPVP
jgi:hypothetical protein